MNWTTNQDETSQQSSNTHRDETKKCKLCGKNKALSCYYSKGNRHDSRCKECTLRNKKKKYHKQKQNEQRMRLKSKESTLKYFEEKNLVASPCDEGLSKIDAKAMLRDLVLESVLES